MIKLCDQYHKHKTSDLLKYLLNYNAYPRRILFKKLSDIPLREIILKGIVIQFSTRNISQIKLYFYKFFIKLTMTEALNPDCYSVFSNNASSIEILTVPNFMLQNRTECAESKGKIKTKNF